MERKAPRESYLVHDILLAWGAHPRLRIWRQNTGGAKIKGRWVQFGVPGTPDILGVLAPDGRFLGIECKSATGRQNEDQQRFERMLTAMGGIYILARSVDDVDRVLLGYGVRR